MNENKIIEEIINKAYEIEKQGRNQEIKVKDILNYTRKLLNEGVGQSENK